MRSMRSALAAAFLVLASWSTEAQPATPAAVRPDVLMSGVTTEVIAILKRDAAAGEPTDVVRLVETKILPLFDFPHMTRIAVARNWRLASPAQQAALVARCGGAAPRP